MLVGISGIDACGKGYVTAKLSQELELKGFSVAVINADGWLNLPHVRFGDRAHGVHFYENALRLDEMFEQLILPLRLNRSIDITADFVDETATEFRPHKYIFQNIDIVLIEGIFLFKKPYGDNFDLKIWIDCSVEAAMTRAVARSQEGLPPDQTIAAYEKIYFPAQRLHFERDLPLAAADLIVQNEKETAW